MWLFRNIRSDQLFRSYYSQQDKSHKKNVLFVCLMETETSANQVNSGPDTGVLRRGWGEGEGFARGLVETNCSFTREMDYFGGILRLSLRVIHAHL